MEYRPRSTVRSVPIVHGTYHGLMLPAWYARPVDIQPPAPAVSHPKPVIASSLLPAAPSISFGDGEKMGLYRKDRAIYGMRFPGSPSAWKQRYMVLFLSSWARVWEPWPRQRGISLSRVSVHYLSRPRRYLSAHPPLHSHTHTPALPPSSAPHRSVFPSILIDTSNYRRLHADSPETVRAAQVLGTQEFSYQLCAGGVCDGGSFGCLRPEAVLFPKHTRVTFRGAANR